MLSHSFDPKQHPEQLDVADRDILSGRPGDGILQYALMNKISDDDSNMHIVEFSSGQELIFGFLGAEASLPFPGGAQGLSKKLTIGLRCSIPLDDPADPKGLRNLVIYAIFLNLRTCLYIPSGGYPASDLDPQLLNCVEAMSEGLILSADSPPRLLVA